jgi:hypothetical protein
LRARPPYARAGGRRLEDHQRHGGDEPVDHGGLVHVPAEFDPPLTLRGNLVVATLAEAAAFTRSLAKPRLPRTKATVLRWLERASHEDEQRKAANMFRIWAESEGVLLQSR